MTAIHTWGVREPSIMITDYGEVRGSEDFLKSALKILLFGDLNSNSLRAIYRNTKKRKHAEFAELTGPIPAADGEG